MEVYKIYFKGDITMNNENSNTIQNMNCKKI